MEGRYENRTCSYLCLMPAFSLAAKSANKTYIESASQFQRRCKKNPIRIFENDSNSPTTGLHLPIANLMTITPMGNGKSAISTEMFPIEYVLAKRPKQ